jgi:hypothetical protein
MTTSKTSAATPRKPAARKKPTARRKPVAKTTPIEPNETVGNNYSVPDEISERPANLQAYTEEERQAMLTTYSALKGAGLPVPPQIADAVEGWIKLEETRRSEEAAVRAVAQKVVEAENATGPWYVRNGYSAAPFSLRLERQTERRRIELKPRGVPGDMHPLEDGDLNDAVLKQNVALGVCEIIPAGEAKRIADSQTHNMTARVHTPTAILRNAKDEEYAVGAVKAELSYDQQGVTVGVIDPQQMQGAYEDRLVSKSSMGGIQRTDEKRTVASEFIPTGGGQVSIQTPSSAPTSEGNVPSLDVAKAKIADDLARRAQFNPMSNMRVTVAPTRKS